MMLTLKTRIQETLCFIEELKSDLNFCKNKSEAALIKKFLLKTITVYNTMVGLYKEQNGEE